MKAILEFNLPEENVEHLMATKAQKMFSLLWDFDQWLRDQIKYHDRNNLQEIRDQFHFMLESHDINLDELSF